MMLLISETLFYIASIIVSLVVLFGIYLMSKVDKARFGNRLSAIISIIAVVLTLVYFEVFTIKTALIVSIISIFIGSIIGIVLALRVKMIQMPELVALLNGLGGAASAIVGIATVFSLSEINFEYITAVLAIIIGIVTLVGSLVAAGKLAKIIDGRPVVYPFHQGFTIISILILLTSLVFSSVYQLSGLYLTLFVIGVIVFSAFFGFLFSIRVGGADMPITISLLNSFSGVAGSIAGMAINNVLLVAVGGIVGASGLVLTQIMCKAMNRSLVDILFSKGSKKTVSTVEEVVDTKSLSDDYLEKILAAEKIIIVPGYGMALSQAQFSVKQLADKLVSLNKDVKFAIHPVAGRMPGHMNVLLAETDIGYEDLYDLDQINDQFANTDVVIVVGANDVINPAANTAVDTPIYQMPILNVSEARHIIICNYDTKPGYAGVPNPLYQDEKVSLLLGDAKESINNILSGLSKPQEEVKVKNNIADLINEANKIIIVPGYGMALSQAQHLVKRLSDVLEQKGKVVVYGIHPVAGRMPGHMNVLLAEVDVDYEKLLDIDQVNPMFENTDVVIIVGANDVINPAANTAVDTPIYQMPILEVDKARHIIICNYDTKPGYAGVDNPLYQESKKVTLYLGDAKDSIQKIIDEIS